ncbi:MAG: hypothetical protein PHD40_03555 [Syntrophomonadaceae bacterium]|nr:hypothetical protein [Syntrophomonadaceae bacterium]
MQDIITKIVENYNRQIELYNDMADLARQQLDSLEARLDGTSENTNLAQVLINRQQILGKIEELENINKSLRQRTCQKMGIEAFVLSQLKPNLKEEEYQGLQEVLKNMGSILVGIQEIDDKNQQLMNRTLVSSRKRGVTDNQARNAYNQNKK